MDILILSGIVIVVIGFSIKKFEPKLWKKIVSKFKK